MLKARESAPSRGGVVKCALALAFALWVTPAAAQEEVMCGPAAEVELFLHSQAGVVLTDSMALQNGWAIEVWEGPTGLVALILHMPDENGGARCALRKIFRATLRPGQDA